MNEKKIGIIRKSHNWMNEEIKRLIRETRIAYKIQKRNLSEGNQERYGQLLQSKKEEIGKSKGLCEIELA